MEEENGIQTLEVSTTKINLLLKKIMDQKTIDLVLKSIESLGNGQKVHAKKVIEFSDAFKNTIEKIIN